jgi:hypothetical protein
MHHIISDGWSMQILFKELLQLYNAFTSGEDAALPPLHIHYKDYAAWQQKQLSGTAMAGHKAWWLKQFEGELPVLELAKDRARPVMRTYHGGAIARRIPSALTGRIRALVQQQDSTLFMGLLAAVNVLLFRYTGKEDIIIGTPAAGREHVELEDQIGHYLNTLALRTRFNGNYRFAELLAVVKALTLEAYEHQSYPFDELVEALNLPPDRSRGPLFDVWVVLHNTGTAYKPEESTIHKLQVSRYEGQGDLSVKFDLSFSFLEAEDELHTILEYNEDILGLKEAGDIAGQFLQIVKYIGEDPDMTLFEINAHLDKAEEEMQKEHLQSIRAKNLSRLKNKNL